MYDDELEDPKVGDLTDFEYRVWHALLRLCNRSPARQRERGYLYHSAHYPVEPRHIARAMGRDLAEIKAALKRVCEIAGEDSLVLTEQIAGATVYRIRAWRKRQSNDPDPQDGPEIPKSSQKAPDLSRPYIDIDVDIDKDKTSCRSGAKPRKLSDEQNAVKQGAIDYFYQRLQKHTTLEKPRFPGGQAAGFFTGCIRDGYDERDLREVTDWFFDERIDEEHSSGNFGHFQNAFNAGCIAVQKRRGDHAES